MQKQMAMMETMGRHDEFVYSAKHLSNEQADQQNQKGRGQYLLNEKFRKDQDQKKP